MKRNKNLKITVGFIAVLLYFVQPGFANFGLFSFLHSKKDNPHYESCKFHANSFYLPYTLNSLDYEPASKANILCDVDIDGDGIPNRFDDCPVTFGAVSLKGCPPIDHSKSVTYGNPTVRLRQDDFNMMVEIFNNLEFEGVQQSLSKKSQKQLSDLVKFLKKEKQLCLYISAYVNIGSNRMQNYYLSESRVLSVSNYLIKNGVEKSRIGTMFFGDMMPVVDLPATRFEVEICDKKR
jgi:flagellar motor protein MotB